MFAANQGTDASKKRFRVPGIMKRPTAPAEPASKLARTLAAPTGCEEGADKENAAHANPAVPEACQSDAAAAQPEACALGAETGAAAGSGAATASGGLRPPGARPFGGALLKRPGLSVPPARSVAAAAAGTSAGAASAAPAASSSIMARASVLQQHKPATAGETYAAVMYTTRAKVGQRIG